MNTLCLPKSAPDPLPELAVFLEPFAPLFGRATRRRSLERYVTGLLTDWPRKNCETIAQAIATTSRQQRQPLLTDAAWDSRIPVALEEQRVRLVVKHRPAGGVLVLDETGVPKQGKASVGVQPQDWGTLGKPGHGLLVGRA